MSIHSTRPFHPFFKGRRETRFGYREATAFSDTALFRSICQHERMANVWGVKNPFFKVHEGRSGRHVTIEKRELINFAWCDYLGLSDHPEVLSELKSAVDLFGSCVSASRMVSGDLQMHRDLERDLAEFCGFDASLLFVSGHAANVSTIGCLMSSADLIVHDEFVHNSAIIGARLSGATLRSFRHNQLDSLVKVLVRERANFENVLIVVEGLYSTEGDVPELNRLIEIKEEFGCWLMVDDAHGLGVLGERGRGIIEYSGADSSKIDILMGTLSKTLASCGGFIAGNEDLIKILRYSAPGFVFSVGLTPSMTAAAAASLRILRREPERVRRLRDNGQAFLSQCRSNGLDTGVSIGRGVVSVIVGSVKAAGRMMEKIERAGINASPIIYPGVPINSSRLRFFISSEHSSEQIDSAVRALAS